VTCAVLAHYAVKEMKRRKLRSVANVLGYVVAVAFLIIIVTLAQAYNAVAARANTKELDDGKTTSTVKEPT